MSLPNDIINKIKQERIELVNNMIQERNKIRNLIYTNLLDSLINNHRSARKVIDIPKLEHQSYCNFESCFHTKQFIDIKNEIDISYNIPHNYIENNKNLEIEYDFSKNNNSITIKPIKKLR